MPNNHSPSRFISLALQQLLDCGVGFWYVFNTLNMQGELGHVSHKDGDGGMVKWWEDLPSTNVALV